MPNTHKICGIIDFAGSWYNGQFLVREIGYVGLGRNIRNAKGEVYDYKPYMLSYADPPARRRSRKSEPLPTPQLEVLDITDVDSQVLDFYNAVKTKRNTIVAFKGGECEKDLLEKLGIPFMNLEDIGCPRFDEMDTKRFRAFACKYHKNRDLHCPVAEVTAFKEWYIEKCKE